jgi:hypothetical protein
MIKWRLEGFTAMNGEDLGHKGRFQAFSKRKVRLQEKGGYL